MVGNDWAESLGQDDWGQDWDDKIPSPSRAPVSPLRLHELSDQCKTMHPADVREQRARILREAHKFRMGREQVSPMVRRALQICGYSWEIEKIEEFWPEHYHDFQRKDWPRSLVIWDERIEALDLPSLLTFSKRSALETLLTEAHRQKWGREILHLGFEKIYGTEDVPPGVELILETWPEVYCKE